MSFITAPIEDDTRQSSCTSPGVQFTFTKVVPVASATARKVISAAGRARAYPPSAPSLVAMSPAEASGRITLRTRAALVHMFSARI